LSIWKQLFILCLLVAVGYGGYEGYHRYVAASGGESAAAPDRSRSSRPSPVEVTQAETRTLSTTVEAVGTTRALQSVEIVPEADGRIVELNITPGEQVRKGDVLVRLDDEIARADLAEAEARLIERRQAVERATSLRRTNAVAEATVEEAQARLAEALAQLDRTARRLEERTITAPFDGVLGLSSVDAGARVDQQTIITRLDDLSQIEVEFALPETLFAQVAKGQTVIATSAAFPGQAFEGEIDAVDNRIDPVSRSFRTRAILPNPEGTLPAGMFMSLELLLSQSEFVVIPEEALIFQAAETYVFVVEDNTARRVVVETGQRRDGMVAVRNGIEDGQTVIVRGLQRLRDGAAVQVLGAKRETGQDQTSSELGAKAATPEGDKT
jgi:membrane fusion protein (multidrug efflux system)